MSAGSPAGFKDALLAEIRRGKRFLYNMVVAQAQKIEVEGDRVTVTFGAGHRTLRDQMEEKDTRQWLEAAAARVAGRRITIVSTVAADTQAVAAAEPAVDPKGDLKAAALSDANVQAVLDIFAADIQDVEEL